MVLESDGFDYKSGSISISVASDGSFGSSLAAGAPSYAGAIGNNGNTLIWNTSFDQANPNDRSIGVAVRCSSCSNLVPVSQYYNAWDPAWSPNGTQIVFTSDKSGNADIWIMNADGSNPKQITTDSNTDWDPAWSPDGSKIVFGHDRDGDENIFNIWVINVDGTNLRQLTFGDTGWEVEATWSPDGSKIAYDGIWVMNADGTNLTKITVDGVQPSWSPDGSQIAFSNADIWIANADGSNPIQITTNSARDWHPSISPDGTKIAFTSNRSGTDAIWVIS